MQKIFQDQRCPLQLVDVGKKIAHGKYQELPLLVFWWLVFLERWTLKKNPWSQIAESLSSSTVGGGSNSRNIIELSDKHLPEYLNLVFFTLEDLWKFEKLV